LAIDKKEQTVLATIKDVAEHAGITVTTVSRVLNNRGYISDKTRQKVYQVMKELDYQPNAIARALVQKNTHIIGVIVPALLHPFFSACLNYFEKYASAQHYKLMVCNSLHDVHKEQEYIEMLKSNKVSGMILCTRTGGIDKHLGTLPVVTLERAVSDKIPAILCDNYQGGKMATEELLSKGCLHVAIISGSKHVNLPADDRTRAFIDSCMERGIEPLLYQTEEEQFNDLEYHDLIAQMFREHPELDGIFATSDVIAAQVLQYCLKYGKQVPQQLKLVGFDDVEIAQLTYPTLTTVHQPIDQMCRQAVEILIGKIQGETVPIKTVMPVWLVKRSTT
jgi:LacI family sucrose operon transcriptional repressor